MTLSYGSDSSPLPHHLLDGSNVGFGWHNVQRKRLRKFARQYLSEPPSAVPELRSQGQTDTTQPIVRASRAGFTEMRVRLPVLDQFYTYSGMHGGTADAATLAHIKAIVLQWAFINQPTGKPIDETNFEGLLTVIAARWNTFSASEQAVIISWLQRLRIAKEAWNFARQPGEGILLYGNHYTHHYKVLLAVYTLLGDTAGRNNVLAALDMFAGQNFPYGNAQVIYPVTHNIVGTSAAESRFDINGNIAGRFPAGHTFAVVGTSTGNDGTYTVASASYLSGSNKTRVFTTVAPAADGGGGTLHEHFNDNVHDMHRAAVSDGESIDYIRRDALHYHQYDLEPWLEIARLEGGTRYQTVVDRAFTFLQTMLLTPPVKHYEFAASTDSFDALRWQASRSEYLQPQAMYRPDKMARVVFAYEHYRQQLSSSFAVDERMMTFALRSNLLPSFWAYYFRWAFGGLYG